MRFAALSFRQDLLDLDEEFKEVHLAVLERFYLLFEGIFKYWRDFVRYIDDLNNSIYIQHTLDVRSSKLRIVVIPTATLSNTI